MYQRINQTVSWSKENRNTTLMGYKSTSKREVYSKKKKKQTSNNPTLWLPA